VTVWLADPLDTIWQIAFSQWVASVKINHAGTCKDEEED
jgi:hypothetical protein